MENWRARRDRLSAEQQIDFDLLMAVNDYNIYKASRGRVLGPDGRLAREIAERRDRLAVTIMDELEPHNEVLNGREVYLAAGTSVRATFDNLPQLPLNRGEVAPMPLGDSVFPDLGSDEANETCDDAVRQLWEEAHGDSGRRVIPPFSEVDGRDGVYNFQAYGMDLGPVDGVGLRESPFYLHDAAYMRDTGYSRVVSMSQADNMTPRAAYQSPEDKAALEAYVANKVVCRANEYLRDHGTHMTVNQAMELRYRLRFGDQSAEEAYESMFNHVGPDGAPVEGRVEEFFREYKLAPNLGPDEPDFARVVEQDESMDFRGSLLRDHELLSRNNLAPVDLFGVDYSERETIINGQRSRMVQVVADYSNVHMYLTGDRDMQLTRAGISVNDFDAVRAAAPFTVSSNDILVRERGTQAAHMMHFDAANGRVVNINGDAENLSMAVTAAGRAGHDWSGVSLGEYRTLADKVGYQTLRQYLKSDKAGVLDTELPPMSSVQQELQMRSMQNAEAILSFLEERGYEYELMADKNPGQIKAVLEDPKMDIRIADPENPHMVGRIYADNLETTIQPSERLHVSNVISRVPPATQPAPPVVVSSKNPSLFARYKGLGGSGRDMRHTYDVCYMPSQEDVLMSLRNRLGISDRFPDRQMSVGSRQKFIGPDGQLYRLKGQFPNAAYHSSSNDMQVISMVEKATIGGQNNRTTTTDVPICISTKYASTARITNPDPARSLEALYAAIDTASDHMKERVFGGIGEIVEDVTPNYQAREWVSYVRDPEDPSKRLLDENGEPVVWRRSKRNPELLENAGKARGDYDSVELSDDPNIRALQETYIRYMRADDAILREVGESQEDFAARIEAEWQRRAIDDEVGDDESVRRLFDSLGFMDEETKTPAEKLAHVQQHYGEMSKQMFGYYDENEDALVINAGGVLKYGGVAGESELCRLIQEAKKEYNVRIIGSDETTVERLREKTVSFDPESARDIADYTSRQLSPFMQHVSRSISGAITASGCTLDELKIDKNGIVQYKATRDKDRVMAGKTEQVVGQIGQIFEPDHNGVYITHYANDSNKAILPSFAGYVLPGEGSVEERTKCISLERRICDAAAFLARTKIAETTVDDYPDGLQTDPLDATALNRYYRMTHGEKRNVEYMAELTATHGDAAQPYVDTMVNSVRYPTRYQEEASMLAEMGRKKDFFVDDRNMDGLSVLGRRIGDIGETERGYFCMWATSGARAQGLTRYLASGARIDSDGHIVPDVNSTCCPLMEIEEMRYKDYNPFDRNQMAFSNLKDSQGTIKEVVMAHASIGGWNMDDAYVISRELAEKNLILTDDADASKRLTADIIEKNLREPPYIDEETGKTMQLLRGMAFEIDPDSDVRVGDQLKERLMEQGVGMRPLCVGDKFCDPNGNKGVISYVVDRSVPEAEAEARGIGDLVKFFRDNPELEAVGAAPTAVSRFNGGSVRSMMEDPKPLVMPDGSVVPGGMGNMPIIISNNTVDHKSHVYDDDAVAEGKGRKASSQLAWSLQCAKADKLMEFCYGENASALRSVREKLIVIGADLDENYEFHKGYTPHTLPDGTKEERPHIKIDTDLIELQVQGSKTGKSYYKAAPSAKAAIDDAVETMMSRGGMLEMPFPVKMATGQPCQQDPETGKYLLPILPIEYRIDKNFEADGSVSSTNYNKYYRDIIRAAAMWETEAKIQSMAGGEVQVNLESSKRNQEAAAERAQRAYDEMAGGVVDREFQGKYNVWKSRVMGHRLENSATLVMTPDPRVDLDVITLSRKDAEEMNLAEGEMAVFWRDPQLRSEGVMAAVVHISDDPNQKSVGMNPANDKRFDGDYDGDTGGVVSTNKLDGASTGRMNQLVERMIHPGMTDEERWEYYRNPEQRLEDARTFAAQFENDLKFANLANAAYQEIVKADNEARVARGDDEVAAKPIDKMLDQYLKDREMQTEVGKLHISHHMEDRCDTPIHTKDPNEVKLALNLGLDVAAGAYAMRQSGDDSYDVGMQKAREAFVAGDGMECFRQANTACHKALDASNGALVIDYSSDKAVFASWEHGIVCGAKGKYEALQNVALSVGGQVAYNRDENGKITSLDLDNCKIYQDDMATPWTASEIGKLPENVNFTPEEANQWLSDQEARFNILYSGSANCTCIKAEYTGLYGAHAQRMAAALRGREDEAGMAVLDRALQMSYCGTQANLQSKHNVEEAIERCGNSDALAALMRGQRIQPKADGDGWEVVMTEEGYPAKLSKEQWAETTKQFFSDKHGLNVNISGKNVEYVAEALYTGPVDRSGEPTMRKTSGKDNCACTMDRLAYGGGLDEIVKCCDQHNGLFDTKAAAQFRPEEPIARPTMKVRSISMEDAQAFSVEESTQRKLESRVSRIIDSSRRVDPEGPVVIYKDKLDEAAVRHITEFVGKSYPNVTVQFEDRQQQPKPVGDNGLDAETLAQVKEHVAAAKANGEIPDTASKTEAIDKATETAQKALEKAKQAQTELQSDKTELH